MRLLLLVSSYVMGWNGMNDEIEARRQQREFEKTANDDDAYSKLFITDRMSQ